MPHRYPLAALLLAFLLAASPAGAQEVLHDPVAAAAAAASDIYAAVTEIDGESTYPVPTGVRGAVRWIDVEAFSHGMNSSSTTTGGGTSGKPDHAPVFITKRLDRSTTPLISALNTGRGIPEVKFVFVRPGADGSPFEFFRVKLEGVFVNVYQVAAAGGDSPFETLAFVYTKVTYVYCQQRADGSPLPCQETTYNVGMNKASISTALGAPVAAVSGDAASFSWGMAEQDGVAGFELQRWEGGEFVRAAYVPGAGWTEDEAEYSASVSGLERGVHLFRVAVVALGGPPVYSAEVRVAVGVADGEGVVVGDPFPNPFALGTALPIASGSVQHARVTVLDVLGREVAVLFDGTVQPGAEALVPFAAGADLPSGVYVLRVVSENGATSRTVTLRRYAVD